MDVMRRKGGRVGVRNAGHVEGKGDGNGMWDRRLLECAEVRRMVRSESSGRVFGREGSMEGEGSEVERDMGEMEQRKKLGINEPSWSSECRSESALIPNGATESSWSVSSQIRLSF